MNISQVISIVESLKEELAQNNLKLGAVTIVNTKRHNLIIKSFNILTSDVKTQPTKVNVEEVQKPTEYIPFNIQFEKPNS